MIHSDEFWSATNFRQSRVLVVAAHSDDDVLGCGGTMAKLVAQGAKVKVVYLADGVSSRLADNDPQFQALRAERESSAVQALAILGVENHKFFSFPDNKLDSVPILTLARAIEQEIEDFTPNIVFTNSSSDLNVDHVSVNRATFTACRPQPAQTVQLLATFEVPSSTGWRFSRSELFVPSLRVDIVEQLDLKLKALAEFVRELREYPHPRSLTAVASLASWRGSEVGLAAAEAFEIAYWRS